MKIPYYEVAALIADQLTQAQTTDSLEDFFYDAQLSYYTNAVDDAELKETARDLGILGDDDEIGWSEEDL
jgi:hypothetical protein